jgi:hypothetical protein
MPRWLSRRWLIAGLVVVIALGAVVIWQLISAPKEGPPAAQIMAPASTQKATVVVGPNVQVSKANATIHHFEPILIAHPKNPARLFVAAILVPPARKGAEGVVGYFSPDNGKTWTTTFGGVGDPKNRTGRRQVWTAKVKVKGP